MSDEIKKEISNLTNDTKPVSQKQEEYRRDNQDVSTRNIPDGNSVKENSLPSTTQPNLERKSFGLMALQSSIDEIAKK